VRCALEEIGVGYEAIDIAPRDRSQPRAFAAVNPWRSVPALRDGEAEVYEIGACLLYLAERFPEADLAPPLGDPARGRYLRWLVWLADAFRPLWERIMAPFFFTTESEPGVRAKASTISRAWATSWKPSSKAWRGAWASTTALPTSTCTCSSAGSTTSPGFSSAVGPSRAITLA
jgi:glutathione S-transferase